MLIEHYNSMVARQIIYILRLALWVFGPALVHLRAIRREDTNLQHLAEAGGEQVTDETRAVGIRCWDT